MPTMPHQSRSQARVRAISAEEQRAQRVTQLMTVGALGVLTILVIGQAISLLG